MVELGLELKSIRLPCQLRLDGKNLFGLTVLNALVSSLSVLNFVSSTLKDKTETYTLHCGVELGAKWRKTSVFLG